MWFFALDITTNLIILFSVIKHNHLAFITKLLSTSVSRWWARKIKNLIDLKPLVFPENKLPLIINIKHNQISQLQGHRTTSHKSKKLETVMHMKLKKISFVIANSLAAIATQAQTQPATPADDAPVSVIVTAQRREQQLQDVPMAITVAGAAQLERQQITTLRDLDRISPAVTFIDGAPGGGAGIRGIATQTFTPSAVASVGIVVDNVPQGNINASNLFDMERVEVLRGPQGTLFGQSASAGVINMVTKTPKIGVFSGSVHADYADKDSLGAKYGEKVVQAVINVPLTDSSAMRVSAFTNRLTGVEHDNANGRDNSNNDSGLRVRYLNNLSDNLRLNLIADYNKQQQRGPSTFVYRTAVSPVVVAALARCGIVATADNNVSCPAYDNFANLKNGGLSAQLDYAIGEYSLTSVTSLRARKTGPDALDVVSLRNGEDFATAIYPQLYSTGNRGNMRLASQEVRLSSPSDAPLEWVVGAYLSRFSYDQYGSEGLNIIVPFDPGSGPIPGVTMSINNLTAGKTSTRSASLFGNATYHLSQQAQLLAGLRITRELVDDTELFSNSLDLPFGIGHVVNYRNVPATAAYAVTNVSGRIGQQYRLNKNLMEYATLSRGFKGAQINDTVFNTPPAIVRPELPTAFEIGMKGAVGNVGIDANLFYTRVKDYQGQLCVYTPALTCGGANVSEVVTKGIEIDVFGKPMRSLTLNGGFIYNAVTYPGGYTAADGTNLGGSQMTGVPKVKLNLSAEYVAGMAGGYQGFVNAETTFKSLTHMYPSSKSYYDVKAHWVTGGRIGLRSPDRKTSLALYVRNIGNTSDPITVYPGYGEGDAQQIVGKQGLRTIGISLDQSF
ncbi:TonB-dependent receptor [Duganella sp. PWIR1]